MARNRVVGILKKIPVGSITVNDREVITSIRTQTQEWKRPEVVIENQKVLFHNTLQENKHMIDPKTGEIIFRESAHTSNADPVLHITCECFDFHGNRMSTKHFAVKKTGEKAEVDEKPKDEEKK